MQSIEYRVSGWLLVNNYFTAYRFSGEIRTMGVSNPVKLTLPPYETKGLCDNLLSNETGFLKFIGS